MNFSFKNNSSLFKVFKSKPLITYDIDADDVDRTIVYTLKVLEKLTKRKALSSQLEWITKGDDPIKLTNTRVYYTEYLDSNNDFIIGTKYYCDPDYEKIAYPLFVDPTIEDAKSIGIIYPKDYDIYSEFKNLCTLTNCDLDYGPTRLKEILKFAIESIKEYMKDHPDDYYGIPNIAYFGYYDK